MWTISKNQVSAMTKINRQNNIVSLRRPKGMIKSAFGIATTNDVSIIGQIIMQNKKNPNYPNYLILSLLDEAFWMPLEVRVILK